MREIKFRVWNSNEMIYPCIIGFNRENFAWEHDRGYLHNCQDWSGEDGFIYKPELMQYTGLKDKNGKEIYEGDILSEKWRAAVYIAPEGTYMVEFHNNPEHNAPMTLLSYFKLRRRADCPEDMEIIGNVYQNPELL